MVMAVTWCAPTPKPSLSPVLAYPLVYPTTYARVYPYYAVPLTYYNSYNSYRWFYPGLCHRETVVVVSLCWLS
ncbi:hypothetical protein EAG_04966 [Camponotus floridanus]|uniref:Uncharacterized protein n=1 Tax=Camponotus floridanus TaxID=104421 RepID=E2AMG0_CAMFO|nr:hypothetical protein EAG_04966 [Camponotus floridanus]